MNYILVNVQYPEDIPFIGYVGSLLSEPTDYELGIFLIKIEDNEINVLVDNPDYVPYSPLMMELI